MVPSLEFKLVSQFQEKQRDTVVLEIEKDRLRTERDQVFVLI